MSLTLPRTFRTPISNGTVPPEFEGVPAVTIFEQVDRVMDAMYGPAPAADLAPSPEELIEEAVIEHEASCQIVETLREALNVAIEQQDEKRRKLMELRGSVVTQ